MPCPPRPFSTNLASYIFNTLPNFSQEGFKDVTRRPLQPSVDGPESNYTTTSLLPSAQSSPRPTVFLSAPSAEDYSEHAHADVASSSSSLLSSASTNSTPSTRLAETPWSSTSNQVSTTSHTRPRNSRFDNDQKWKYSFSRKYGVCSTCRQGKRSCIPEHLSAAILDSVPAEVWVGCPQTEYVPTAYRHLVPSAKP